jgi:hypothetical protein
MNPRNWGIIATFVFGSLRLRGCSEVLQRNGIVATDELKISILDPARG